LTKQHTDRGEISTETVLLVPALMFIVLLVVQTAVVLHGANMASHVAARGALAASQLGATTNHTTLAVNAVASSLGARLAAPPLITTERHHVRVRVWVVVPQAVPFFVDQVSREVSVPRERYIAYADR
jgi:Flp pilus assembly protein TadG